MSGPDHDIDPDGASPWLLGARYEATLAPSARSAGAHFTPADVAARLCSLVLPSEPVTVAGPTGSAVGGGGGRRGGSLLRVWDPACGGGVFLLAAADALLAAGGRPDEIVSEQVWGTDVDAGAVAVAEAALCWWAAQHGVDASPGDHLAVADALLDDPSPGHRGPLARGARARFDVVVGNPPFQGQLAGSSVRTTATTAALRARWGSDVVGPYTDTASLFLVAGGRALAPGGRLVMILPTSVLSARDAAGARAAAADVAPLTGLWVATEAVFGASVDVCAVVLERPGPGGAVGASTTFGTARPASTTLPVVRRWKGRALDELPPATVGSLAGRTRSMERGGAWSGHALVALGVPDPPFRSVGLLGSIATARAGFRDEYYGLVGHVGEATRPDSGGGVGVATSSEDLSATELPLVTSGLIDPGRCAWGERSARFARQRYQRPVVDLASLRAAGGRAAAWVESLIVPKVVVATQTRVGEAAVDEAGRWVASTPTIAVLADPDRLWEVAAVICSPVGTIAALAATAGAGLGSGAIRHGVASIVGLPLPVDAEAWSAGAAALHRLDRPAFLAAMSAAYGVAPTDEVDEWWIARAPWSGA